MKTKIFALFLGLLCLLTNALAQSETLTGFNGRIKFTSFANNGLYVRGTLDDFIDQTNQYVASDIDSADVVWDNLGRRYLVHAVLSSNLTQAVVDLSRIGGGTHIPSGVGFVSRETSNGLALIPPVNSTGISTQLASRAGVHNMKILEGLKTIYTGGDSVRVPNILVQLANNGVQSFAIGCWPNFPSTNYNNNEYGILITDDWNGEVSFVHRRSAMRMYNDELALSSYNSARNRFVAIQLRGNQQEINLTANKRNTWVNYITLDTTGVTFKDNTTNGSLQSYKFPLASISKPSETPGAISSLYWLSGIGVFLRSQHGLFSSTTDGSGDLAITFPEMPDTTYTAICQSEGNANSYTWEVHAKTTTSFKIRVRDSNTKAVVTATSVTFGYKIEDY